MKKSQNIAVAKMQVLQGSLRPHTAGTAGTKIVKRFLEENEIQSNN